MISDRVCDCNAEMILSLLELKLRVDINDASLSQAIREKWRKDMEKFQTFQSPSFASQLVVAFTEGRQSDRDT